MRFRLMPAIHIAQHRSVFWSEVARAGSLERPSSPFRWTVATGLVVYINMATSHGGRNPGRVAVVRDEIADKRDTCEAMRTVNGWHFPAPCGRNG